MLRATVGILGAITMAFVGFIALSRAADESRAEAMNSTAGGDAYNATTGVLDGVGQALAPGLVWMGVAAVVLIALGLLYTSTRGAR